MTLKKNDIVNLTITSATAEGSGVGRTDDGIAVFVQGSAIGDELKVRILKVKKTYAFGKIEEILVPSKARITPDCENFMKCGGCTWRHISYEEECKIKQQRVEDAVTRIGGLNNVVFKPIISSDNITRYRNKAQYPVGLDRDGNVVTGFYSFHSHRIINCTDCILQPEIFARVIEITKDFIAKTNTEIYDETTGKGRLRHIYIRIGEVSGELMVCYVVNANGLKQEDLLVKMLKSELPQLLLILTEKKPMLFSAEKTEQSTEVTILPTHFADCSLKFHRFRSGRSTENRPKSFTAKPKNMQILNLTKFCLIYTAERVQ